MRTIYLLYVIIPDYFYNTRIKYLIDSKYSTFKHKNEFFTGLYAWSNKKDIVKKFINSRADIFIIEKRELSEKEYKKYKKDYSILKLDERRFYFDVSYRNESSYNEDNDDEYIDVVTTKFEFIASTEEISENMTAFGPIEYLNYDYKIFNYAIQDALDILQYTSLYDYYIDTTPESDEMIERKDVADYQEGFNMTINGNSRIHFDQNEYAALLYLFSYVFLKV